MRKISINNFRGFKNQQFNFSKVNILIGENSGGKSSFLKFLLALKQTILEKDINLKLYGKFVDLGNYKEIIYEHNDNNNLSFSFDFNSVDYFDFYFWYILQVAEEFEDKQKDIFEKQVKGYIGEGIHYPTTIKLKLNKNLNNHHVIKIEFSNNFLGKVQIEHKPPQNKTENIQDFIGENPRCKITFKNNNKILVLDEVEYTGNSFLSLITGASLKKRIEEKSKDDSIFYKIAFLLIIQNYLTYNLGIIRYVNPLLASPKRHYEVRDYSDSMEVNLEKMVTFLGDSKRPVNERHQALQLINNALNIFGLADSISINTENPRVYELRAKIKGLESNITDIGFGVSVQLPILFQIIRSQLRRRGETILIEQPELHLHPKLQAMFIDTILKIGFNNTYFIETHSEHIIRKLQSIVKNKTIDLKRDDITIHYFKRENEKFVVTQHSINENFRVVPNLPSGFFDASYLLARERM